MLERIGDYFLERPSRLIVLGRILCELGAFLVLAGLIGLVITSAPSFVRLGGAPGPIQTLADIFPSFPTWWIPETLLGGMTAIFLFCLGLWLNVTGRRFRRYLAR